MKKVLYVIISVLLVFTSCQVKQDVVKVGVILPLTGHAALTGQMAKKGVDMFISKLTTNNSIQYEIIFEDCKSSPKEAITSYNRLYSLGVRHFYVFGGQFAMAVAPITKGKDVIMFTTGMFLTYSAYLQIHQG